MKTKGFLIAQGNIIVPLAALISFILLFICDTLGILGFILTIFLVYVFRNDSRHIFTNQNNILSPVDAKVIAIDKVDDKIKIYCEVGIFGSHKVLSPISGKLEIKDHKKGLNLDPNSFKGSLLNEQVTFSISNEELAKDIEIELVMGKCSTSIDFSSEKDIQQGETIATMVRGMAVIILEEKYELDIKLADDLKAGQSTLTI